jgi:hypothetical protein
MNSKAQTRKQERQFTNEKFSSHPHISFYLPQNFALRYKDLASTSKTRHKDLDSMSVETAS